MSDAFALELSRQAAARAALGLGLKEADPAAIDCLADVTKRYITMLAHGSQARAEASGRAAVGSLDILLTMARSHRKEDSLKDLREFVRHDGENSTLRWNQPFVQKVLHFPAPQPPQAGSNDDGPKPSYVPRHLPSFPPPHTYRRALVGDKRNNNDTSNKDGISDRDREKRARSEMSLAISSGQEIKEALGEIGSRVAN